MRFFLIVPIAILFVYCSSQDTDGIELPVDNALIIDDSTLADSAETASIPSYSFESFETPGLGWGYKIFDNGTLFINQPHIPAIQGNKGFSTKEKAEITAQFAILKMEQGFVPPTISPEELDSLGVLD